MQLSSYPTDELITLQLALSIAYVQAQKNEPEKLEGIQKWNDRITDAIVDSVFQEKQLPFNTPNNVVLLIEKI